MASGSPSAHSSVPCCASACTSCNVGVRFSCGRPLLSLLPDPIVSSRVFQTRLAPFLRGVLALGLIVLALPCLVPHGLLGGSGHLPPVPLPGVAAPCPHSCSSVAGTLVGDPDEPMFSSARRVSANKCCRSNLSISLRGASSYLLISGWAVWSPPARPLVLFQASSPPGGEGISSSRGSGGGPVSVPLACTSSSWSGPVTESVLAFVDRPSLSGL